MSAGALGLALAALLLSQQPQTLNPNTIVAVQTAPARDDCNLFCGEFTMMTLAEARAKYDELGKIESPTRQQIQLLAALRISIGMLEGQEACRLGQVPSCRVLPVGYRQTVN